VFRKCPRCGSFNVRRSSVRISRASPAEVFRSPYRCRNCGERFSVASRNVYYVVAMLGAMIVAGAVGQVFSSGWDLWPSKREPAALVTGELASTIKRAESGDTAAERQLAQMYAVGDGVPRNEKEAARWLERAAGHGDAESQYEMGVALREGRGTVQDDAGAFAWLQRAADAGNARAQFELGRMYFLGAGIPADKIRAYTWLNLAAAQGAIGAASLRDVVRGQLTTDEISGAQADARRLSEIQRKRNANLP
jgi:hypothetical protein